MPIEFVRVPQSLLYNPRLTTSAKVVWMALQLERSADSAGKISISRLAAHTGVSRPTVYKALRSLSEERLYPYDPAHSRAKGAGNESYVRIPTSLITNREISTQSKVVYGLLKLHQSELQPQDPSRQTGQDSKEREQRNQPRPPQQDMPRPKPKTSSIQFTYTQLARITQLHRKTIASAIRTLANVGWLIPEETSRKRPITCRFKDPRYAQSEAELERVKRRLSKASFRGEALMREFLNLLVDSDQFEDDAAPGFLVNPLTDERLQFDRYYPPSVAFEFNGPQHYGPTDLYTEEDAIKQRTRDLIKMGLCAERGITLIIVHPEDLTLATMKEKIGNLLPLRDLTDEGPRISYLQAAARLYRRRALSTPFHVPKASQPVAASRIAES